MMEKLWSDYVAKNQGLFKAEELKPMPNRLQRFIERGSKGETSGRIAYVLKPELLVPPQTGMEWQADPTFNAAEELLKQASLKQVYAAALKDGVAVVKT
jgi:hypothetical protein